MRAPRGRKRALIAATAALAACVFAAVAFEDTRGNGAGSEAQSAIRPVTQQVPPPADPEVDRPNVVLITVDDLAEVDLPAMPLTRKVLGDEGVTLTQGLAPTPICAPARASLLTGQYAHNNGVHTVDGARGGFSELNDKGTLPVWLSKAGYDTMFVGKYLNHYGEHDPYYVPPGWNRWRGSTDPSTYAFFGTQFNVDGRLVRPSGYGTDVISDYSSELLRLHHRGPRSQDPFFLWVNYVAPHHGGPVESDDPPVHWPGRQIQTTTPDPRDRNTFSHARLPRVPSMWEADVRGNAFAGRPNPSAGFRAGVREAYQQRLESLQDVDRAVAHTVTVLRRTGELRRTVIWLTSDNGFLVGQHNLFGKLAPYDDSLRIPMFVRGPGIPRDRVLSTPVTNPDVAVTIARLADARPTRALDGVDAWPWLTGTAPLTHDRVIPLEAWPVRGRAWRLYSGIRYGDFTYVRARDGHEELYDRGADPGELVNMAQRPAYRDLLRQLRRWDERYRNCAGATCPRPS